MPIDELIFFRGGETTNQQTIPNTTSIYQHLPTNQPLHTDGERPSRATAEAVSRSPLHLSYAQILD